MMTQRLPRRIFFNSETNVLDKKKSIGDFAWLMDKLSSIPKLPSRAFHIPTITVWENGAPKYIYTQRLSKILKTSGSQVSKRLVRLHLLPPSKVMNLNELTRLNKAQNHYKGALRLVTGNLAKDDEIPAQLLTEKQLLEVLLKWHPDKLKGIRYLNSYAMPTGNSPYLIRIKYNSGSKFTSITNNEDIKKRTLLCFTICQQLCESIKKHCGLIIKEMHAEFITTEDNALLCNTWKTVFSVSIEFIKEPIKDISMIKIKEISKKDLLKRLQTIQDKWSITNPKLTLTGELYEIMGIHVDIARQEIISDTEVKEDPSERIGNEVFKTFRPDCKFLFTDLINPSFDPYSMLEGEELSQVVGCSKQQITQALLKGRKLKPNECKLILPNKRYASFVSESFRILHHVVPKDFKKYRSYLDSIDQFNNLIQTNKKLRPLYIDSANIKDQFPMNRKKGSDNIKRVSVV